MTIFLSALGRGVGTLGFVVMLHGVVRAAHVPSRAYTTADGLAHTVVNRIVGDSRGYFWFCTREGLSRFDGSTFVTYGIDHGLVGAEITDFRAAQESLFDAMKLAAILRHEVAHLESADESRAYELEAAAFRALVGRGPTHFVSRGLAYANELDRRAAAADVRSGLTANASRGAGQKVHVVSAPPPLRH